MKSGDLHKLWSAPDNSRLTAKQQSFRLPVHVAAKIAALVDLFPGKTKTEIVGDLLHAALEELILNLPATRGDLVHQDPGGDKLYEEEGMRAEFRRLTNKYFKELERELGTKNPPDYYADTYVISEKGEA